MLFSRLEMNIQDQFIRPPRWALVFWSPPSADKSRKVDLVVLLDPFEADIAFRELRFPQAKMSSLHRFAPRNCRDQKELLTSGLTLWGVGDTHFNQEMMKKELDFVVMSLSIFGATSCYDKKIPDGQSVDKIRSFLGLIPLPLLSKSKLTSRDWEVLTSGKWIESDGFVKADRSDVNHSSLNFPVDISRSCLEIIEKTCSMNRWHVSPIEAIFALIQIRNLEPWYENSDLHDVLGIKHY